MLDYLDMDYFRNTTGPMKLFVTGDNRDDFMKWLLRKIGYLDIKTPIEFVTEDGKWDYHVSTGMTEDACISFSIAYDTVWWQRGYWFTFKHRNWKPDEELRYWNQMDTLDQYGGKGIGLPECQTDEERDTCYSRMVKLSDFVAKTIAQRLLEIGAKPNTDNIVTIGSKISWYMLRPIDEDESDVWTASKGILRLYADKTKRYCAELKAP